MGKEILVCVNHREKEEVPLIWTFAFTGAEYWCPACGFNGGMLGGGIAVEETKTLKNRLEKYKKKSKAFLSAKSAMTCSYMRINGEKRTFDNLPPQTKSYYRNKARSWKYKF